MHDSGALSLEDLRGRPYRIDCQPPFSFNCWELFLYVRAHFIGPPVPVESFSPGAMIKAGPDLELMIANAKAKPCWRPIESFLDWQDGDLILMRQNAAGFSHCGIFCANYVMHAYEIGDAGQVMVHDSLALRRYFAEIQGWRYVG